MPVAFMAQLERSLKEGCWVFYATWSMSTQEKRKEKHVNSRIDTAVKIEFKKNRLLPSEQFWESMW